MLVVGLCRMQKRRFRCGVDLRKASHPGMFTVVRSVCLFVGWVVMQNYSSDWSWWTWHMYLCILKLVAVIPVVCALSITWWMWHLYLSVLSISVLNCNFATAQQTEITQFNSDFESLVISWLYFCDGGQMSSSACRTQEVLNVCCFTCSTMMTVNDAHYHHNRFYSPFPGPPGWASARRELLDFMVQGKINWGRHTDHLAGRHFIYMFLSVCYCF